MITCTKVVPHETKKRLAEALERIKVAYEDGELDVNDYADMLMTIGMLAYRIEQQEQE